FTPVGFGPEFAGFMPLEDWRLNILYNWRYGDVFTWRADQSELDVTNNIKWRDWNMVDLRLSKNFQRDWGRVQLFLDVDNIFNLKYIWDDAAWVGPRDRDYYLRSLHLPEDTFEGVEEPYDFIYGDDQPGDMRARGVEYQPIEIVGTVDEEGSPHTRPLYYEKENDRYMVWENGSWSQADQGFVDQVMEDQAYIDMPNSDYLAYLFPRQIYLGIRISF
ncbi:MAG TPA: hypothetical protein VKA68_08315, partial [bacterium]|nr:hypothetical protein [bacterium]